MANINRYTDAIWNFDTSWYANDFINYTTATDGVSTVAASGTAVAGSTRSGVVVLTTGGTQNQSAGVATTNNLYLFAAGKPIYGRSLFQYTEAATNAAGVFVGFVSSPTAAILTDTTGAVRTTGSLACVYKLTGTTVWTCHTRNGTTFTDTPSTKTAGGTLAQLIECILSDWDGVSMMATYRVDNEFLRDANNNVIRHQVPIASATIMSYVGAFVKNPAGATSEVGNLDYMYAHQLR